MVVLEAMKMQSNYKVTSDCTVRDILVNEGDSVNANQGINSIGYNKRRLIMTREEIYSRFEELDKRASLGGGVDKIEKQHAQGKMTARERIGMLLDKGTFNELDKLVNHRCTNFGMEKKQIAGDGMVTGYGKIDGRPVFVYAYDFTAHGGSLSETNAAKIVKVQQLALKTGAPVIALNDSGGARIQEGVNSLAGYASIFYQNTIASGVIPQISAILGPCAGGACYSPALTDFIFMVKEQSHMFITGPDVVKTVTNEEVGKEELGGAQTHSGKSGVTHFMCDNEEETLMSIRELLSFLPSNNMEDAPLVPCNDDIHRQVEALQTVIPEDPNMPYDIKDIIEPVLDNQYFFEVMPHFAKNVVVGFGRLGGRSVGIVANQPAWLAGVLDIDASDKAARFIRFCDCFNIPLITFEDVPGFLPGTVQEHNGIIRHGAKIVYAYAEATVPKVTLITRKAYGGAYIVMSSKPTGADVNLAYPQAEIAVMGAEGAVNILYRKSAPEEKAEIIKEYEDKFSNPYRAAERGLIDEVIMPRDTRYKLIQALEMCHNKNQSNPPKKHGNMPL
ncbi:carboxyl transferase domain-containing protein [Phocaeicola vulgatus]|nr:carboxyl transferase domain-containing protein [Phocaeicola vulgatus]UVO95476.1 methylmalonyl-CoA carboxyltransferase [Phocaeicola vulgatus]